MCDIARVVHLKTTKELSFDTGVEYIVALACTTVGDAPVNITPVTENPSAALVYMDNGWHCDVISDAE